MASSTPRTFIQPLTGGVLPLLLTLSVGLVACSSTVSQPDEAATVHATEPLHLDDRPTYLPVPELTVSAQQEAETLATLAMGAFVDHTRSQEAWFARLVPYLTDSAATRYLTVSPDTIRPTSVLVDGVLDESNSSGYLARVAVPTDAGTYIVLLQRLVDGDQWLVERISRAENA